jgi:predicted PilT family ATPase
LFFFICKSDNENSIKFLENQLEFLTNSNFSLSNAIVILNHKSIRKVTGKVKSQLARLNERFGIFFQVLDLNEETSYTYTINEFIKSSIALKSRTLMKNSSILYK